MFIIRSEHYYSTLGKPIGVLNLPEQLLKLSYFFFILSCNLFYVCTETSVNNFKFVKTDKKGGVNAVLNCNTHAAYEVWHNSVGHLCNFLISVPYIQNQLAIYNSSCIFRLSITIFNGIYHVFPVSF